MIEVGDFLFEFYVCVGLLLVYLFEYSSLFVGLFVLLVFVCLCVCVCLIG